MVKAREIQMQLHGAPELELSRPSVFGPDQEIQFLAMALQQAAGNMRAKVAGGSGDEYCHGG